MSEEDAVARARAIAARLSGGDGGDAGPPRKKSRWGDDGSAGAGPGAMVAVGGVQDALATAMGMAGNPGNGNGDGGGGGGGGGGRMSAQAALAAAMMIGLKPSKEKKKLYIPTSMEFGDIDFRKLLIGPRGMTQKKMEERTGAKILIRGRGSQKDGGSAYGRDEEDDDDLHVLVEGDPEAVERAASELELIMSSPDEAMRLKEQQLRDLKDLSGGGGGSYGGGGGGGGDYYGPSGGGRGGLGMGGRGDEQEETVEVPNAMVGSLIGRGGENIQSIQRNTSCHVQLLLPT